MSPFKKIGIVLLFAVIVNACNLSSMSGDEGPVTPAAQTSVSVPTAAVATATSQPLPSATATLIVTPIINNQPETCVPDGGWPAYIVQPGNTLGSIAARSNSTIEILSQTNCISNPNVLQAGQTIYVPVLPIPGVPLPAAHQNPSWSTVPIYSTFGTAPTDQCVVSTESHAPAPLYRVANVSEPYNGTLGGWGLWMSNVNGFYQIIISLDGSTIFNAFVRQADVVLQGPCPGNDNDSPDSSLPVFTSLGAPPADKCVVTVATNQPMPLYKVANLNEPYNGTLGGWGLWMSNVNGFYQIIISPDGSTIFNAFVRQVDVVLQGPCPGNGNDSPDSSLPVFTSLGAPPADKCVVTIATNQPVPLYKVANVNEPYNGTLGGWGLWMSNVNGFYQIIISPDGSTIFNAFVRQADVVLQGPCPVS